MKQSILPRFEQSTHIGRYIPLAGLLIAATILVMSITIPLQIAEILSYDVSSSSFLIPLAPFLFYVCFFIGSATLLRLNMPNRGIVPIMALPPACVVIICAAVLLAFPSLVVHTVVPAVIFAGIFSGVFVPHVFWLLLDETLSRRLSRVALIAFLVAASWVVLLFTKVVAYAYFAVIAAQNTAATPPFAAIVAAMQSFIHKFLGVIMLAYGLFLFLFGVLYPIFAHTRRDKKPVRVTREVRCSASQKTPGHDRVRHYTFCAAECSFQNAGNDVRLTRIKTFLRFLRSANPSFFALVAALTLYLASGYLFVGSYCFTTYFYSFIGLYARLLDRFIPSSINALAPQQGVETFLQLFQFGAAQTAVPAPMIPALAHVYSLHTGLSLSVAVIALLIAPVIYSVAYSMHSIAFLTNNYLTYLKRRFPTLLADVLREQIRMSLKSAGASPRSHTHRPSGDDAPRRAPDVSQRKPIAEGTGAGVGVGVGVASSHVPVAVDSTAAASSSDSSVRQSSFLEDAPGESLPTAAPAMRNPDASLYPASAQLQKVMRRKLRTRSIYVAVPMAIFGCLAVLPMFISTVSCSDAHCATMPFAGLGVLLTCFSIVGVCAYFLPLALLINQFPLYPDLILNRFRRNVYLALALSFVLGQALAAFVLLIFPVSRSAGNPRVQVITHTVFSLSFLVASYFIALAKKAVAIDPFLSTKHMAMNELAATAERRAQATEGASAPAPATPVPSSPLKPLATLQPALQPAPPLALPKTRSFTYGTRCAGPDIEEEKRFTWSPRVHDDRDSAAGKSSGDTMQAHGLIMGGYSVAEESPDNIPALDPFSLDSRNDGRKRLSSNCLQHSARFPDILDAEDSIALRQNRAVAKSCQFDNGDLFRQLADFHDSVPLAGIDYRPSVDHLPPRKGSVVHPLSSTPKRMNSVEHSPENAVTAAQASHALNGNETENVAPNGLELLGPTALDESDQDRCQQSIGCSSIVHVPSSSESSSAQVVSQIQTVDPSFQGSTVNIITSAPAPTQSPENVHDIRADYSVSSMGNESDPSAISLSDGAQHEIKRDEA